MGPQRSGFRLVPTGMAAKDTGPLRQKIRKAHDVTYTMKSAARRDRMKLQEGEMIGAYRVIRELGHGGMSQVYQAHDTRHDREVVLKFPNDELMGDPANYERFRREVKIGNILNHPNIQKLYELAGGTEAPYLVMEYVPGGTLREEFSKKRSYRPELEKSETMARSLGKQIGNALAYTHANGVFHRDLKPEKYHSDPRRYGESDGFRHRIRGGLAPGDVGSALVAGRHSGLHGPRTDQRAARQRPHRYLRTGHDPVRVRCGSPALSRRQCAGRDEPACHRQPASYPHLLQTGHSGSGGGDLKGDSPQA